MILLYSSYSFCRGAAVESEQFKGKLRASVGEASLPRLSAVKTARPIPVGEASLPRLSAVETAPHIPVGEASLPRLSAERTPAHPKEKP